MAGRKIIGESVNHLQFDGPQDEHYLMAEELRPTSNLYAEELIVWDRITPWLASLGRLQPWYIDSLCEYCRVIVSLNKNSKFILDNGETYTVDGRNGDQIKSRPQVGQRNEDRRMLRSYVSDFGLSPAAERLFEDIQGDVFNSFAEAHKKANG